MCARRPRDAAYPNGGRLKREWSLLAIFWPSQQELLRYLKYMARTRIPEFESDMPSHAVWSLWDMSRLQNCVLAMIGWQRPIYWVTFSPGFCGSWLATG